MIGYLDQNKRAKPAEAVDQGLTIFPVVDVVRP
jgi:hypothetical protein